MTYSKVVAPGLNNSDATFRTWSTALHDHLIAAGLVQTTDTGQVDLTIATWPTTSTFAGYRMYRFADTLQATAPVFVRIQFGSGNPAGIPTVSVQVGTATNGAGTLGGRFTTQVTLLGTNSLVVVDQYVATGLDKSYLALFWHVNQSAANWGGSLVVDRSRNADGTPNGDGLYVLTNAGTAGSSHTSTMLSYTGAVVASGNSPTCIVTSMYTTAVQGLEVSLFPHFCYTPKLHAPVKAVLSAYAVDLPYASAVTINHFGAAPFLSLGDRSKGAAMSVAGSNPAGITLAFRAE